MMEKCESQLIPKWRDRDDFTDLVVQSFLSRQESRTVLVFNSILVRKISTSTTNTEHNEKYSKKYLYIH